MIANPFSVITHEDIWDYHYIGDKATCPCCKKQEMTRDDHSTWERSHIIPKKGKQKLGPYIHDNVRPVCPQCNIGDRKFSDNYAYMVKKGTMTKEERAQKLEKLQQKCANVIENPDMIRCSAITGAGHRCTYRKKAHMETCNRHGPTFRQHMDEITVIDKKKLLETLVKEGKFENCNAVANILGISKDDENTE